MAFADLQPAPLFHGNVVFASEAFAIASALCTALSTLFLSELRGRVLLFQLARWQMLATFAMTGLVSLTLDGWRGLDLWQFGLLAGSSFFGIMIASTTYFAAIYTVGPRVTALLFSLTSPFALALGYIVLDEAISSRQGIGVALVLIGVLLAIDAPQVLLKRKAVADETPAQRLSWLGVVFGVITALGQASGSLMARPAMASGVEPFTGMAVRSGLAAAFFIALATLLPVARGVRSALRPDTIGIAVASAFFGTTLGMSCLLAALHQGELGVVSTLSSLTPVVILPMVWIRSRRRPSASAWIGAALAIVGTAFISI